MTLIPHVLGLTYNGAREDRAEQTIRVPFTLAHDATRFQVSLAPGQQDAEESSRWVTTVALVGAHVGVHAGGGVMSEIVHSWDGADLSSGAWLSTWADAPLRAGVEYVLSFAYTNPNARLIAAGTMAAYRNPSAAEHANVGGGTWALDTMRVGPMSPAIVYDTTAAPPVVTVVGDSNAAGRGATLPFHEAYAHVAARATGQVVIPLGYSGETTSAYDMVSPKWTRVLGLAGLTHADAVVIASGINDLGIGRTAALTLSNLDRVVTRARAMTDGPVHVATLPPASWTGAKETARQAYNQALRAGGHGDGVIDLDEVLRSASAPAQLATQYAGSDAVHYGTAGHVAAAQALTPLIESLTPDAPSLGTVEYAALPMGTVIFREPARGRRVALRNPANGHYVGQAAPAAPVARLFAPEDPSWEWVELPDADGAVAATYPYPAPPAVGADAPNLITEASVVTGNATGLGPQGSTYSWSVERQGTQPAVTTGPLLRARTTGSGTPLTVTLTITPPSGAPIVHIHQVTCLTMDGRRGRHQADTGGRTCTIDARFTAPTTGTYRVLWEQLDTHAQLLPKSARLSTITLTAGQTHTPDLTVTPPTVTALRTYAWRCVIEDPTGGVHVSRAIYHAVHPAPVTDPIGDDRLPVPAGPLAQMVHTFPLQAPGDDEDNPAMTQAQAVAAFTDQILAGGMVLNCTDYGIPAHEAGLTNRVLIPPIDGQYKMAPEWGWIGWEQLVAPAVVPTGAVPAAGADGALAFWDPETGEYTETWKTTRDEFGRIRATQGGRTNLLTTDGRWERPGAGVSAAGLLQGPHALSLYTVRACLARIDVGRGFDDLITHTLLVVLPQVRGFVGGTRRYVHPAIKSDGTGASDTPLMGARFRLSNTVDMNGWSPLARVIGRWLQLAGCVITDSSGGAAAIVCRAYPERMMGGAPNPWNTVFPEGRGWSSALPEIGRTVAWQALKPGHVGTPPAAPIMPPATGLTETETVVVDGATVHFTNLEGD